MSTKGRKEPIRRIRRGLKLEAEHMVNALKIKVGPPSQLPCSNVWTACGPLNISIRITYFRLTIEDTYKAYMDRMQTIAVENLRRH